MGRHVTFSGVGRWNDAVRLNDFNQCPVADAVLDVINTVIRWLEPFRDNH